MGVAKPKTQQATKDYTKSRTNLNVGNLDK